MKKGKYFFRNLHNRVRAGTLALVTAFLAVAGSINMSPMTVEAADAFAPTIYRYTAVDQTETFTVPASGWYTIDLYGGAGGSTVIIGRGSKNGGNGGRVSAKYYFNEGEALYINIGNSGRGGVSDGKYLPVAGGWNGGGNATSVCFGSGGGASDIRLGNNNIDSSIMVAGGGGASSIYQHGRPGGEAGSGNNRVKGQGTHGSGGYAGGGGGFYGGVSGSASSQAYGGSNYINASTHNGSVIANSGGVNTGGGWCVITRESNYNVTLDLNGGYVSGSNKNISYSYTGAQINQTFNYAGRTQAYTIPEDGYYRLTVKGGSGGGNSSGGSRGGNGGSATGITYFEKGTVLYVNVGGAGHEGSNVAGGWNGGGQASDYETGSSGGGATDISLDWSGANTTWNNTEHLHSRLIVAGGGGGSDNTELGAAGTGDDGSGGYGGGTSGGYPTDDGRTQTLWAPGTQTSGYAFGYGQRTGSWAKDGGAGGGGWYGGIAGGGTSHNNNATGNQCGGAGGSGYVWTASTQSYYPNPSSKLTTSMYLTDTRMVNGANWGNGSATIQLLGLYKQLPTPTRDGYEFTGWEVVSGNGSLISSDKFEYAEGNTVIKANWEAIRGYGQLDVDPNSGVYQYSDETSIFRMLAGQSVSIDTPTKYGYIFKEWTYTRTTEASQSPADEWTPIKNDPVRTGTYVFGYESKAKLVANWELKQTNLTIDPNGGVYNGSASTTVHNNLTINSAVVPLANPTRTGYNFQYWEEINGSDGYVGPDGWHAGTIDGYLKAVWEPITYTVHYEPNCPEGLTLTGTQADQLHTYDQAKALAVNAEYNDPTGFKIPNVKFLWWNTKPDGSGKIYKSGETVMNLSAIQDDVVNLYAQWMVTYTINHHVQNLDGTYTLKETDEYKLVPLTKWNVPLHDYHGWYPSGDLVDEVAPYTAYPGYKDGYYPSASKEIVIATTDTTLDFYYPLVHYNLSYDLKGGEWFEEQSDGSWIAVAAPPSEYTVLTPDIRVTRPDKVGFTYLGYTGTEVPNQTMDVVIPKGSLGDRSYVANWEAQAYEVDVPVSILFSVAYNGDASGMFDQNGDSELTVDGYVTNHSLFPVQTTSLTLESTGDFTFTHDKTLDETHPDIMNWRLDVQNKGEWNQYAPELLSGIDTANNDIFWMAQNSKGNLKMNVNNAWALHGDYDIKEPMKIGRIVYTFDIGHRLVKSRSVN